MIDIRAFSIATQLRDMKSTTLEPRVADLEGELFDDGCS
jgi:hypothetical protein